MSRTRLAVALSALSLTTCSAESEIGRVEADLYDVAVDCDPVSGECRDTDNGAVVAPSSLTSWAFTSTESERFDDGLFVYFELQREDGTVAHVQLDLPGNGSSDAASFVYVETNGERRVFESSSARGHVEIPIDILGADCICTDGRFELIFVDPGEDGVLRTRDDRTRRLSRARFAGPAGFCLDRHTFRPPTEDVVEVNPVNRCPARPDTSSPSTPDPDEGDDTYEPTTSTSCGSETSSSDSGCGSESSSESDGCGGESSSTESDGCGSDSGGCEGDSSGGGCEGDSAGGGCEGDAGGGGCGGCDTPKAAKNLGRMQLGLMVGAALFFVRRKRRK